MLAPTVTGGSGTAGGNRAPLLERKQLLAELREVIDEAAAGRGRLVVVAGAPGVGKSRLLGASGELAREAGMRTLAAQAGELEGGVSFGVVRRLFGPALAASGPDERASLLTGAAAHSLPVLEGTEAASEELFPRLHGLFWLAQNLAEASPLTLIVDDIQWADASSLRALLYLAQRLEELPICVLCATRTGEGGTHAELVRELRAFERALTVPVEPLSREAVGELLASLLAPPEAEFVVACAEATGGNPFLIGELAAELRAERIAPVDSEAGRVTGLAPQAVMKALLLRIARLGPDAVELARAVAVLGDEVPLRRMAALAGLSIAEAARGADALAGAAVLAPGEPLSFIHPLVRSSVDTDIPRSLRSLLSRRAADLLHADGEPAERIAALLARVTPAGDAEAVGMLLAGGESAFARGDPEAAAAIFARALAEPPVGERQTEVLRALGRTELAAGLETAVERLSEVVAASAGTAEHPLDLQALGRALFARGRHGEAAGAFETARNLVGASDAELSGHLDAEYVAAAFWDADLADTGLARARELTGPDLDRTLALPERELLVTIAAQKMFAVEDREESLALALRAIGDDDELARQEGSEGQAVHVVGGVLLAADEFRRYEQFMTTAIDEARRRGSVMAFASTSYSRIAPRLELGLLVEALADAEAAIASHRYGWSAWLPGAYVLLVEVLILRAELDRAHDALADLDLEPGSPWDAVVMSVRGKLALAEGRAADARANFEAWGQGWHAQNPAIFGDWRSFTAIAAATLGDHDAARSLADEELDLARRWGAARPIAVALRALGLATGGAEGIEILREAVSTLDGSEAIVERARVLSDLGAALRAAGHQVEAREPLRGALDIAHNCGARILADRAFEELRLTGAKPRRRAVSGVDSLTPSELQVARMAADGASSREIAERLFVTLKAVEWHVRNACRKLEIGRDELASALEFPRSELSGSGS